MDRAIEWTDRADVFLVVGTSLVVQPAAGLPARPKARGARLIIVNRDETPLDAEADVVLRGNAGEILPRLAEGVSSPFPPGNPENDSRD